MKERDKIHHKSGRFLIVDDEILILNVWKKALTRIGHNVVCFDNGPEALEFFEQNMIDVVILDHMMPEMTGLELLRCIKNKWPHIEVVMMTGFASIETALEAMKAGAYDYLQKPFEQIEVAVRVAEKALERKKLVDYNRELEERLELVEHYEGIIGSSPKMQEVFRLVEQVINFDATIMICGETGTGKERIARAIHLKSPRRDQPFVPVVCSAFPDTLIESALFGHRKGAFTGANNDKLGLIESAHEGTLFLDEVGDIPLPIQVKLLRVLQEGDFRRLGDVKATPVDIRILTATHRNLKAEIAAGKFREDLYYRLNVVEIELPPLRERLEDIPLLAHHFLRMYSNRYKKYIHRISQKALELLQNYYWPGNVRQLEHTIARALILEESDELTIYSLPKELKEKLPDNIQPIQENSYLQMSFREAKRRVLQRFERRYLLSLLNKTDNNISQASRIADMDRANFRRMLKKHDLSDIEETN